MIPVPTFWDRCQGSVSKFSKCPYLCEHWASPASTVPFQLCGTFVSSSVCCGNDGPSVLHAIVISHIKSLAQSWAVVVRWLSLPGLGVLYLWEEVFPCS